MSRSLDKLANENGMTPEGVARDAELLAQVGLEPEDVSRREIREAREIHRAIMQRFCNFYGVEVH